MKCVQNFDCISFSLLLQQILLNLSGSMEQISGAFEMIFKVIVDDPQSGSCPYISYSEFKGPVASANPSGSPFASGAQSKMDSVGGGAGGFGFPGCNAMMYGSGAYMGSGMAPCSVESLKSTLRNSGLSVQASDEITAAMCTLAGYGLLGSGFGFANFGFGVGPGQCGLTLDFLIGILTGQRTVNSSVMSGGGMQRMDKTAGGQFPNGSDMFPVRGGMYNATMNQNSFGLGTGMGQHGGKGESVGGEGTSGSQTKELQISENIVGAVLGHGGRAIVEIQRITNTTIQISKKGVFAPGTRNRIATISGSPAGVERAMVLVQQCIQQEESKRNRQEKMLK